MTHVAKVWKLFGLNQFGYSIDIVGTVALISKWQQL